MVGLATVEAQTQRSTRGLHRWCSWLGSFVVGLVGELTDIVVRDIGGNECEAEGSELRHIT